MTVSADTLRLAIVREATPGVTPATPAFLLLRATSESLAFTPETQLSNELSIHRQVPDVIVSGGQSGGDISFEVSSNPGFEMLLEGVLANAWAADVLTVGSILYTHTIEKRFSLKQAAAEPDDWEYNRFVRCAIDSMSLTFTPGGPATGSATILGGTLTRDDADITGATYTDSGQLPVMVGSNVLPIEFDIEGTTFTAWCLSNLVVNFRNNGRAIACLGVFGAGEVVLGRFECEITAEIYINKETDALMQAFIDGTEIALSFEVADSLDNRYKFSFSRVRVQSATELAGGTNQDVIMSVTLQALVDAVTAPVTADTAVVIERVHTSTPWPVLTLREVKDLEAAKANKAAHAPEPEPSAVEALPA